ncbi:unnamed protein product [Periconia digitata]|uniref:Uncharacterized protein n=1 Tax=Periconia digitata TaxID=1303443 RepID=A0A9W4UHB4_9PLEO|nr:unnamed protein product [Periconia digitata]
MMESTFAPMSSICVLYIASSYSSTGPLSSSTQTVCSILASRARLGRDRREWMNAALCDSKPCTYLVPIQVADALVCAVVPPSPRSHISFQDYCAIKWNTYPPRRQSPSYPSRCSSLPVDDFMARYQEMPQPPSPTLQGNGSVRTVDLAYFATRWPDAHQQRLTVTQSHATVCSSCSPTPSAKTYKTMFQRARQRTYLFRPLDLSSFVRLGIGQSIGLRHIPAIIRHTACAVNQAYTSEFLSVTHLLARHHVRPCSLSFILLMHPNATSNRTPASLIYSRRFRSRSDKIIALAMHACSVLGTHVHICMYAYIHVFALSYIHTFIHVHM